MAVNSPNGEREVRHVFGATGAFKGKGGVERLLQIERLFANCRRDARAPQRLLDFVVRTRCINPAALRAALAEHIRIVLGQPNYEPEALDILVSLHTFAAVPTAPGLQRHLPGLREDQAAWLLKWLGDTVPDWFFDELVALAGDVYDPDHPQNCDARSYFVSDLMANLEGWGYQRQGRERAARYIGTQFVALREQR